MFCLKKGDKIGVVSPSGIVEKKYAESGLEFLKKLGFVPVLGKHVFDQYRYMAGTPIDRAKDIMGFYKDPEIKAIFATRGGAGSQFVLPHLDYKAIKKNPKPLFGFSDTTALQNALFAKSNVSGYSGFLLGFNFRNGDIAPKPKKSLMNILQGKENNLKGGKTLIKGKAKGKLVGGNLSLMQKLCGTPFYPDLSGKILLLEDIGGKSYQIDLALEQLRQNPNFSKLKGIVFGQFENVLIKDKEDGTVAEIIDNFCEGLKVPVIRDFPYAHSDECYVLPIGLEVELDATNRQIKF